MLGLYRHGFLLTNIDREYVGFGASGRNCGRALAIFPVSLHQVARFSSHAEALHLQAAMNDTVGEIGRVLVAEGIAADHAKQGLLSLVRSDAQLSRMAATVRDSTGFGLPEQWQPLDARAASATARRYGGANRCAGWA